MDGRRTLVIARDPSQARAYAARMKKPAELFKWCATEDDLHGYDPMLVEVVAYGADLPHFCALLIRMAKQLGYRVEHYTE